ncbi:MAG: sodium-dependent transporter [Gammaproteobacteria bacterium]
MDKKKSIHGEWSSWIAFILAATGSAVGLGNIWKFPYITGQNGGGAFVMVYLLCVAAIGIPIMIAETMMGRRARQSPINALQTLSEEVGADSNWHYLGWMGVIAGFLILSYYSVIAGWACAYVLKAFTGSFSGESAAHIKGLFETFIHNPWQLIFWHTVFLASAMSVVVQGVQSGLERVTRFLMPALFVLLVLLVGYAMTTNAFGQGMDFLFKVDFDKLTGTSVLTAMGQAFFSLGLGMGAIMVYGSYLPSHVSIAKTTFIIAAADTAAALLSGMAIFPIVFENGLTPAAGPGLIFESLPIAFGQMTGGLIFGTLFFVLVVFAALTSAISLIEPAVAWLVENHDFSREKACIWAGTATWIVGLGTILSFNAWAEVRIFERNFYELLDYLTANLMLPIGGFSIAVFAGWIMKREHTKKELEMPGDLSYDVWRFAIQYVAPAGVFLVFLHVVGVI